MSNLKASSLFSVEGVVVVITGGSSGNTVPTRARAGGGERPDMPEEARPGPTVIDGRLRSGCDDGQSPRDQWGQDIHPGPTESKAGGGG